MSRMRVWGRRIPAGVGFRHNLRLRLILMDAIALGYAAALSIALVPNASAKDAVPAVLYVAGAITVGVNLTRWQGLHQASRSSIRTVELTGIVRVAVLMGVVAVVVDEMTRSVRGLGHAVLLTLLTALFLTGGRSVFRAWLRARRNRGQYLRPVVVVGADEDAARIVEILADHSDQGYLVVGACGSIEDAERTGLRHLWCGGPEMAAGLVRDGSVTGAIVVSSALSPMDLNRVVREIVDAGGHVHLAVGLRGLASDRITSEAIAHEPLLHLQPWSFDARQALIKRAVDVTLSTTLLVLASPVLLGAMALTKASSRGPVLFRQKRVGLNGHPFEVLKLRTMEVGADARIGELAAANLRNGPLFKMANDPRVTPVGRILRATSIDELPQLWNVLRGEMSLVGPRPALPSEVAEFPEELRKRTNVLPGVTGLWQVEARDNPSFAAYWRLDLFYVENWTVTFDLVILLATIESEITRVLSKLFARAAHTIDDNSAGDMPERTTEGALELNGVIDLMPAAGGRPGRHDSALID